MIFARPPSCKALCYWFSWETVPRWVLEKEYTISTPMAGYDDRDTFVSLGCHLCSHSYQHQCLAHTCTKSLGSLHDGREEGRNGAHCQPDLKGMRKSLIRREPTCQHFRAILALLLGFLWKLALMWPRIQGVFYGSSKGWYSQSLAKWRAWTHQLWLSWGSLFRTSH